jgi:GDP-mannose 6-dehydrogenase
VLRAVKEIGQALAAGPPERGHHTIVVRSTVPPGTVDDLVLPTVEAEVGRSAGDTFGVAMCPEFLREGSGISDFFDPPFTVVGTADERAAAVVMRLFEFIQRPLRVVPVRTAEGLKYACNAFHATKVSFTNELSRLYRSLGVDSRMVMELFRQDERLNISPSYLRPGFAFGGSCLPKDLRSLLHLGRMNGVDLPLLHGTLTSNQLIVDDVVKRVIAGDGRCVAILGLSFKMQTDDLRESPYVELTETLLGKGFDIRIYDPIIQPSRLVGANLRYVESRLPHLGRLLADNAGDALRGADVAVVSSSVASVVDALLADPPRRVIDLAGGLDAAVEALPGYEGVGW